MHERPTLPRKAPPPGASRFAPGLPGAFALRRAVWACWPMALALVLALLLRHWVVEPANIAHFCDPQPWEGWCAGRTLVISSFVHQRIGWLALGAGLFAFATGRPGPARLALAAGAAGLVLYSYEPSAIGALLGGLVLVRSNRPSVRASA